MKMWKKAASLALASAMVFSLAACGGGKDSSEGNADATTFKIGGIGPITGDTAIYGTAVQNGIQLAVDEINADGGINGYQIEYSFEDDQNNSEKSVNAYNTLKDWGMQMLVGTVTSTPCTAVYHLCQSSTQLRRPPRPRESLPPLPRSHAQEPQDPLVPRRIHLPPYLRPRTSERMHASST